MSSVRSNSPASPRDPIQVSGSTDFDTVEIFDMNGDKEGEYTPPTTPLPINKENYAPEKVTDCEFPPVGTYGGEDNEGGGIKKEEPSAPKSESISSEPIVISTSITTTYVKDLHELCQSLVRLTPHFEFEQRKPQEFTVVLKLVGPEGTKEIALEESYPSKRHAKEAASCKGIVYVKSLPKNGGAGSIALETLEKDEVNWVGLLSDACNIKKVRPHYIDYATPGAGFSCEIRLGAGLGFPGIEEMVFGDKHRAFKNKRSAKIAAAKAAMQWINEQKASSTDPSVSGSRKSGKSMSSIVGGNLIYPYNATPAQIVNLACPHLGINTPEYHLTADPRAPGMYDIFATIKRPKGPKNIMVGPMKSVHGKKKAKEEMSRGVYNWLRKEAEKQGLNLIEGPPPEPTIKNS